ncbi:MAG: radical SAM protein [Crenarchaeota archaeon]|nr:radical SAM protein [Thermoproteota archaeon]
MLVRASIGSQAVLGITSIKMLAEPTTIYLLQYSREGCMGGCIFCPQSRRYRGGSNYVSRIDWPPVDLETLKSALRNNHEKYHRVCIQSIIKPSWLNEYLELIEAIKSSTEKPISAAVNIIGYRGLLMLKQKGVERVGVGLDAVSEKVFRRVGKPGSWNAYWRFIEDAVKVFGRDHVTVHVILGLGEKEEETMRTLRRIYDIGARAALFAYTHAPGTAHFGMRPGIEYYRRIQVLNYLLMKGWSPSELFVEDKIRPRIARMIREDPYEYLEAVLTSGCPGCNRPFYNERPSGPIYNYPSHKLLLKDKDKVAAEIRRAFEM